MQKIFLLLFSLICFASCHSNNAQTNSSVDSVALITELPDTIQYIANKEDVRKLQDVFKYAEKENLKNRSISEIEIDIAKQLLEIPYIGATLERDEEEALVLNLRGLDCTTFVENVFALSYCIKNGTATVNDYCKILKKIRYRDGEINKYPSRLHYFTEWLVDNENKGLINIVSNQFGNENFVPGVGFMSSNPDKYSKLLAHPEFVETIKQQEEIINKTKFKYITKDQLESKAEFIKDGDIIAFTTKIKGLDISHVGIAAFKSGRLHFYHASSSKKKVVLSEKPMSEYMKGIKSNSGVLVARIAF